MSNGTNLATIYYKLILTSNEEKQYDVDMKTQDTRTLTQDAQEVLRLRAVKLEVRHTVVAAIGEAVPATLGVHAPKAKADRL